MGAVELYGSAVMAEYHNAAEKSRQLAVARLKCHPNFREIVSEV
jgi:hypothetical protein